MSYFQFCFRFKFACLFIATSLVFATSLHAAEWRDCKQAKLHALQLQQNSDSYKTTKRKSRRHREDRLQRAEDIDTWLWKNCREFSYELRKLEQEKM